MFTQACNIYVLSSGRILYGTECCEEYEDEMNEIYACDNDNDNAVVTTTTTTTTTTPLSHNKANMYWPFC
jgi:hypothetical protein